MHTWAAAYPFRGAGLDVTLDEPGQSARVIEVPSAYLGWAMVRDPLLAVPLARNPAFEALKREVDPPN
jgi:hypothetical protein